ncbi:MAG: 4Fe-4S binding protein, partial [Firmicutes bacterium]|nr:4Fe-4S binding protein [Bacillota bacterium]
MEIRVRAENCTICGACAEECPFGAITMGEECPDFNEGCTLCGACIEICPTEAIYMVGEAEKSLEQPGDRGDRHRGVWVFA